MSAAPLQAAVEDLYQAFSAYRMPEHVDMSPYRDPERELGALWRHPLREIRAQDLESYAEHALTTVGDVGLLKYALPRLLDLVARRVLVTDAEIVLGKLAYGGWRTWPQQEQEAVHTFLVAWWLDVLESPVEGITFRAKETLGSIVQVVDDLTPYLQMWEDHPASTATDHLANTVNFVFDETQGALTTPPFWQEHARQVRLLHPWLARPATLDRLKQVQRLVRGDDHELEDVYAWALDALRLLKANPAHE